MVAIKEAQDNMGDFKLKTAQDYIVPEKQRVNAEKKRMQLMELKEQVGWFKCFVFFMFICTYRYLFIPRRASNLKTNIQLS